MNKNLTDIKTRLDISKAVTVPREFRGGRTLSLVRLTEFLLNLVTEIKDTNTLLLDIAEKAGLVEPEDLGGEGEEGEIPEPPEKKLKIAVVCSECRGTGLYHGFMEREGEAVICHYCKGKGGIIITPTPFVERRTRSDIKSVVIDKKKITYQQFLAGGREEDICI